MYIALTGSENNKDVYIYHSFRKENGKSSSRIYKKLGKYNTLLQQFDGDRDKMMAWAREQADKETKLYKEAWRCLYGQSDTWDITFYANDTTKYSKWLYSFLHKNRINGFSAQNIRLQNGL